MVDDNKNLIKTKICIVGLGPAGIATAFTFGKHGFAKDLICIDAGNLNNRNCPVLSNKGCRKIESCQVISGLGGCFLFGKKISHFPAGSGLVNILGSKEKALKETEKAFNYIVHNISLERAEITNKDMGEAKGFFEQLGFKYKYYNIYVYNANELRKMFHDIISSLEVDGARIFFKTRLIDIEIENGHFVVLAKQTGKDIVILTDYLVIGVGRLGNFLLKRINSKFKLGGKENHLEVGVRIEFPTRLCPDIDKYHKDLKLLFGDARTYCLSKNGKIALYHIDGVCFTEGYSTFEPSTDLTNIGILVRLKPSSYNDRILYEIKKRTLELTEGKPGVQVLDEYLRGDNIPQSANLPFKASISYWEKVNISSIFPFPISERIRKAVYYFVSRIFPKNYWKNIIVFAPEVHYAGLSFPVKSDFSILPKMYLIGECTGKFRGVLQSFTSGMICAENIIGDINENEKKIQ